MGEDHGPLAESLGARRPDVVRADDVEHARPREAGQAGEAAVGSSVLHSFQPLGMENPGSPLGTVPSTATPCACRSKAYEAAIAPTTAINAPGILLSTSLKIKITPSTEADQYYQFQLIINYTRPDSLAIRRMPLLTAGRTPPTTGGGR